MLIVLKPNLSLQFFFLKKFYQICGRSPIIRRNSNYSSFCQLYHCLFLYDNSIVDILYIISRRFGRSKNRFTCLIKEKNIFESFFTSSKVNPVKSTSVWNYIMHKRSRNRILWNYCSIHSGWFHLFWNNIGRFSYLNMGLKAVPNYAYLYTLGQDKSNLWCNFFSYLLLAQKADILLEHLESRLHLENLVYWSCSLYKSHYSFLGSSILHLYVFKFFERLNRDASMNKGTSLTSRITLDKFFFFNELTDIIGFYHDFFNTLSLTVSNSLSSCDLPIYNERGCIKTNLNFSMLTDKTAQYANILQQDVNTVDLYRKKNTYSSFKLIRYFLIPSLIYFKKYLGIAGWVRNYFLYNFQKFQLSRIFFFKCNYIFKKYSFCLIRQFLKSNKYLRKNLFLNGDTKLRNLHLLKNKRRDVFKIIRNAKNKTKFIKTFCHSVQQKKKIIVRLFKFCKYHRLFFLFLKWPARCSNPLYSFLTNKFKRKYSRFVFFNTREHFSYAYLRRLFTRSSRKQQHRTNRNKIRNLRKKYYTYTKRYIKKVKKTTLHLKKYTQLFNKKKYNDLFISKLYSLRRGRRMNFFCVLGQSEKMSSLSNFWNEKRYSTCVLNKSISQFSFRPLVLLSSWRTIYKKIRFYHNSGFFYTCKNSVQNKFSVSIVNFVSLLIYIKLMIFSKYVKNFRNCTMINAIKRLQYYFFNKVNQNRIMKSIYVLSKFNNTTYLDSILLRVLGVSPNNQSNGKSVLRLKNKNRSGTRGLQSTLNYTNFSLRQKTYFRLSSRKKKKINSKARDWLPQNALLSNTKKLRHLLLKGYAKSRFQKYALNFKPFIRYYGFNQNFLNSKARFFSDNARKVSSNLSSIWGFYKNLGSACNDNNNLTVGNYNTVLRYNPGYYTLWRKYRFIFKKVLGLRYYRQRRLTNFILNFWDIQGTKLLWGFELSVFNLLLASKIFINRWTAFCYARLGIYVNGNLCYFPFYTVALYDVIQVVSNVKIGLFFFVQTRYLELVQKKYIKSYVKVMQNSLIGGVGAFFIKLRLHNLVKYVLLFRQLFFDCPNYIDVDYFTLTIIVIYYPNYFELKLFSIVSNIPVNAMRSYNWKYIT